jgi:ketopantoate hydroxymethyltransferase
LVVNDLLGFGKNKTPSFVKPKINLYDLVKKAVNDYARDVKGE